MRDQDGTAANLAVTLANRLCDIYIYIYISGFQRRACDSIVRATQSASWREHSTQKASQPRQQTETELPQQTKMQKLCLKTAWKLQKRCPHQESFNLEGDVPNACFNSCRIKTASRKTAPAAFRAKEASRASEDLKKESPTMSMLSSSTH